MIKIYDKNFIIHTVPLEKFYSEGRNFILEIDDTTEQRKKIIFEQYGAIKLIPSDAIKELDYRCREFKKGEFPLVIMMDDDSKWIKDIDRKCVKFNMSSFDDDGLYNHYIMFIGDFLFEIIAHKCTVENI